MDTESLEQTKAFIRSHLPQIEALAEETIQKEGYSYPVWASLEWTVFPEKTYGDITFPAGTYEALRIQIGEAQGHNWWCVLYPSLCFIDSVHAVVPEKGKKQLVLRLSPTLWEEIARWADEDFRSINGQIEYLLTECVRARKKK